MHIVQISSDEGVNHCNSEQVGALGSVVSEPSVKQSLGCKYQLWLDLTENSRMTDSV